MFEYRCPACEAVAYSSAANGSSLGGCPACGNPLDEAGAARRLRSSRRAPRPEELIPPYARAVPLHTSVQAVRAPRAAPMSPGRQPGAPG